MCENCTIKITPASFAATLEVEIEELKPFFDYIEKHPDTSVRIFLTVPPDGVKLLAFQLISAPKIFPLVFDYDELLEEENLKSFIDSIGKDPFFTAKIHFASDGIKWLTFTKNVQTL